MRETLIKDEEFKDSPVGRVPKDWDVLSIESFCLSIADGTHDSPKPVEKGYPLITSKNLKDGKIDWEDVYLIGKADYLAVIQRSWVEKGDILFGMIGTIGNPVILTEKEAGIATKNVGIFRFGGDLTKSRWFLRVLESPFIAKQIQASLDGSTQKFVALGTLRSLLVPVPQLRNEMERVAEILDVVDEAISHTSSIIAKLKLMKAGLLHDLLTRGLDENGELRDAIAHPKQFKDSLLGQIPKNWETPTFEEVTVDDTPICYGIVQPGSYVESGIPVIAIQNLNTDYRTNIHKSAQAIESRYVRSRICSNDLLLSVKGTIGRVGIVPSWFIGNISRDVARIRLKSVASPQYVRQMLLAPSSQKRLEQAVVGTTRAEVSIGILRKLRLPLPPLPEQELIADVLNVHDTRIRTEEAYRDKLKLQKQGLMHDLLTGKVRVNDM